MSKIIRSPYKLDLILNHKDDTLFVEDSEQYKVGDTITICEDSPYTPRIIFADISKVDDKWLIIKNPREANQLHVFETDYFLYVAIDEDDAWDLWCSNTTPHLQDSNRPFVCWTQLPDDLIIWLCVNEYGYTEKKTCAEWANQNGRGFLCGFNRGFK